MRVNCLYDINIAFNTSITVHLPPSRTLQTVLRTFSTFSIYQTIARLALIAQKIRAVIFSTANTVRHIGSTINTAVHFKAIFRQAFCTQCCLIFIYASMTISMDFLTGFACIIQNEQSQKFTFSLAASLIYTLCISAYALPTSGLRGASLTVLNLTVRLTGKIIEQFVIDRTFVTACSCLTQATPFNAANRDTSSLNIHIDISKAILALKASLRT